MPICTTCTHPTSHLYTVYESEYNLRLEQCPQCLHFVDPYVEHDALTILLDLFLLKRGVYLHLLYNRGAEPRKVMGRGSRGGGQGAGRGQDRDEDGGKGKDKYQDRDEPNADSSGSNNSESLQQRKKTRERWILIAQLGSALTLVDAFIRWMHLSSSSSSSSSSTFNSFTLPRATQTTPAPWTNEILLAFLRVFLGTLAETVAFHGVITLTCSLFLRLIEVAHSFRPSSCPKSSIRQQFQLSLISLSLFYSSLTKLFLLFLLTIWLPTTTTLTSPTTSLPKLDIDLKQPLPDWAALLVGDKGALHAALTRLMGVLDDDKLDREWVVRNVVGGMSAGFGLRVILDIHPLLTTLIILSGWAAKNVVARLVSTWVGADEWVREAWVAYSVQ